MFPAHSIQCVNYTLSTKLSFFFPTFFETLLPLQQEKENAPAERERENDDDDDDDDDCGVNLSKATLRLWQRKGNERRRENVLAVLRMKMSEIGKTRRSVASKNAHT